MALAIGGRTTAFWLVVSAAKAGVVVKASDVMMRRSKR